MSESDVIRFHVLARPESIETESTTIRAKGITDADTYSIYRTLLVTYGVSGAIEKKTLNFENVQNAKSALSTEFFCICVLPLNLWAHQSSVTARCCVEESELVYGTLLSSSKMVL